MSEWKKTFGILVVDDNFMMLEMMVPMLKRLGYQEIITAKNVQDAWDKLNSGPPIHIILSDLVMPGMSGVDFLDKVRSSAKFWDLPFVMITGEENKNQLMSSIEIEVDSYILKPFTQDKLESEINRVLVQKYRPSPYQLVMKKGRTLLAENADMISALQAFQEASRLQPNEATPYYFSAIINERLERTEDAKACLTQCIQMKEAYPKAYDLLALIYNREGNHIAVHKILSRICELSPKNLERNLILANACSRVNDQEGVRKWLKASIRLAAPDDLETYDRIFDLYAKSNMAKEAVLLYRNCIDKNLENPQLLNKYAMILKGIKDYEASILFLERIVQIWRTDKHHSIAVSSMAVYYFNLSAAYVELANTSKDSGQQKTGYENAEKMVNKAIKCDFDHTEARKLSQWISDRLKLYK